MNYHRITYKDCLEMADEWEKKYLENLTNHSLLKFLAGEWCKKNDFTLGGYLGGNRWDATRATT